MKARGTRRCGATAVGAILLLLLGGLPPPTGPVFASERLPWGGTGYRVERDVVYGEVSGERLTANLFLPEGNGPFPAVLLIHGGGWAFGTKLEMGGVGVRLAERGFAAVSIDYRLAPKHQFPAQLEDCAAALRWMSDQGARYGLDTSWTALYGYSAGGHLALLLALREWPAKAGPAARPRAVVAGGAPTDFRDLPARSPALAFWLGGTREQKGEVYRLASPAGFAHGDAPPIYLYHGEADRLVPLSQCHRMAESLKRSGAQVEVRIIPGRGHVATFLDGQATSRAVDYLVRQWHSDHEPK